MASQVARRPSTGEPDRAVDPLSAHIPAWYQNLLTMVGAPARPSAATPDARLLAALYGLEASALLLVLALHARAYARAIPSLDTALLALWVALAAAGAGAVVWRWQRSDRRRAIATALLNLIPVLVLAAAGEGAVRLLARPSSRGP